MRKILREFQRFAFKGNVLDMAVGVMIGAAFGAIVNSLVNDLFMPCLSLLTGRIDLSKLAIALGDGEAASAIRYGAFIQAVINFLVIAACVFALVKVLGMLERRKGPTVPPRTCPYCRQVIAADATRCPFCTSQLDA